ncbi:MAG: stage II sporulation protein M [Clostridia bacterium]|nr:stage II sporulation protein M [Clostridia bacterium]
MHRSKTVFKTFRSHKKEWVDFLKKNAYALFFIFLLILGAVIGCVFYSISTETICHSFSSLLIPSNVPKTFSEGCLAVFGASLYNCLLLALLFLFGLTAYGSPLILTLPIFFGFCIGITECRLYGAFDWLYLMTDFLPPTLISIIAIVSGCVQSLRMSCLFSRQLLPTCAHCGGMWHDFKLYLLRFLFCFFLAFLASSLNVILQIV